MGFSGVKIEFPQFEGKSEKYFSWRFAVDQLFESKGLVKLRDDIIVRPMKKLGDGVLNDEEKKAMPHMKLVVTSTLRGEAQIYAASLKNKNPPEMLQLFDDRWNAQHMTSRMASYRKLINGAPKSGEPLAKHFANKEMLLRENLRDTVTPDEILTLSTLSNLPSKYKDIVTLLLSDKDLDYEKAKKTILEHEVNVQSEDKETDVHVLQARACNPTDRQSALHVYFDPAERVRARAESRGGK